MSSRGLVTSAQHGGPWQPGLEVIAGLEGVGGPVRAAVPSLGMVVCPVLSRYVGPAYGPVTCAGKAGWPEGGPCSCLVWPVPCGT